MTEKLASCVISSLEDLNCSLASQYGNIDEQLVSVAKQLEAIPELQDGFDGIGFSQGMSKAHSIPLSSPFGRRSVP